MPSVLVINDEIYIAGRLLFTDHEEDIHYLFCVFNMESLIVKYLCPLPATYTREGTGVLYKHLNPYGMVSVGMMIYSHHRNTEGYNRYFFHFQPDCNEWSHFPSMSNRFMFKTDPAHEPPFRATGVITSSQASSSFYLVQTKRFSQSPFTSVYKCELLDTCHRIQHPGINQTLPYNIYVPTGGVLASTEPHDIPDCDRMDEHTDEEGESD